jgi:transposase-like protein
MNQINLLHKWPEILVLMKTHCILGSTNNSRPSGQDKAVRTDDHLYEELKRLKKENARLTVERDLLKKAAAYFAKEQR